MGKLSCAEQDICEAGLARFYSKPFCDSRLWYRGLAMNGFMPSVDPGSRHPKGRYSVDSVKHGIE
jgi:hypothetical protein